MKDVEAASLQDHNGTFANMDGLARALVEKVLTRKKLTRIVKDPVLIPEVQRSDGPGAADFLRSFKAARAGPEQRRMKNAFSLSRPTTPT